MILTSARRSAVCMVGRMIASSPEDANRAGHSCFAALSLAFRMAHEKTLPAHIAGRVLIFRRVSVDLVHCA